MNEQSQQKQKTRPWFWMFVAGLFVIFVGGSGLWYLAANQIEQIIEQQKERLSQRQQIATCSNQQIRGYPFRLGVFCDDVSFTDVKKSTLVKAGPLRTAAQFYAPGTIVAELDGPATAKLGSQQTATVNWASMRSSLKANLDGIKEFSAAGTEVNLELQLPEQHSLVANRLELHARKSGLDDLEAALGALNLDLSNILGTAVDPVTVTLEFTAFELFETVFKGRDLEGILKDAGISSRITALKLEPKSGGKLSISGPLNVDRQGLVTSDLVVNVENTGKLFDFLKKAVPDRNDEIKNAEAAVIALGGNGTKKPITIKLQIRNSNISLGLIPLGTIPPLF